MKTLLAVIYALAVPFWPETEENNASQESDDDSADKVDKKQPQTNIIEPSPVDETIARDNSAARRIPRRLMYDRNGVVLYDGPQKNYRRKYSGKSYLKTKATLNNPLSSDEDSEKLRNKTLTKKRVTTRVVVANDPATEIDENDENSPVNSRLQPEFLGSDQRKFVPLKKKWVTSIKASPRCYPDDNVLGTVRNVPPLPMQVGSLVRILDSRFGIMRVATVVGFISDYVILRLADGTTQFINRVYLQVISKAMKTIIEQCQDEQ